MYKEVTYMQWRISEEEDVTSGTNWNRLPGKRELRWVQGGGRVLSKQ
jgi:hypothetical protein